MSENSFPQVSRAALKRLFSLSVHDSLPAETQRRVSRETNTNRSACQVSQSLWWSVYSPAAQDITRLMPSWLSASVDTTSFLYIILVDLKRQSERERVRHVMKVSGGYGSHKGCYCADSMKSCSSADSQLLTATQFSSVSLPLSVSVSVAVLIWNSPHKQFKASCGSLGEWGQRLKVYQSSGSLRWARAVRTAASPVWPAQERGMEKVERRGMRHAMVLRWTDWKEGGKKEKERKRKKEKEMMEGRKEGRICE